MTYSPTDRLHRHFQFPRVPGYFCIFVKVFHRYSGYVHRQCRYGYNQDSWFTPFIPFGSGFLPRCFDFTSWPCFHEARVAFPASPHWAPSPLLGCVYMGTSRTEELIVRIFALPFEGNVHYLYVSCSWTGQLTPLWYAALEQGWVAQKILNCSTSCVYSMGITSTTFPLGFGMM
jgi:hypothetical protein